MDKISTNEIDIDYAKFDMTHTYISIDRALEFVGDNLYF